MDIRVRFAPSPTGQIHIGNIRTAIFNWLFARHEGGKFLLRIEDTDRERSTQDAIDKLLECMDWLNISYDETVVYQSEFADQHIEAAERLIEQGLACRPTAKNGETVPVMFRIPYHTDALSFVRKCDYEEIKVHADVPVSVSCGGVNYAGISKKGKPVPDAGCLAGFSNLEIIDANGNILFKLEDHLDDLLANGTNFSFEQCTLLRFLRKEVFYHDLIKGELSKPLDGMKDLVIVRSNGSPVFHLANVCDDVTQGITHIIRGDDHVENTYRHLFLFDALNYPLPQYAHLPMIVNQQGKPYSKRDGDAFVGDFRQKGYLPHALFNYLTLLGWSPGNDQEKLSEQELIELFTLERVKSHAAQFDHHKLQNLNGLYIAEMAPDKFVELSRNEAAGYDWGRALDNSYFSKVAKLMLGRTKLITQVATWSYFFTSEINYDDPKALKKSLNNDKIKAAIVSLTDTLQKLQDFNEANIESEVHKVEETNGIGQGKLNKPIRIATTGRSIGAGLYETMALLGRDKVVERLRYVLTFEF